MLRSADHKFRNDRNQTVIHKSRRTHFPMANLQFTYCEESPEGARSMNGFLSIMFLFFSILNLKLISENIIFIQQRRFMIESCPARLIDFLALPEDSPCKIPDLHHRPRKSPRNKAPEAICAILEQAGFSTGTYFYPWPDKPYKGVSCDFQ